MTEITIIEPQLIESRSFEIISEILGEERLQQIPAEQQGIVKRVIHTSADLIMPTIWFSAQAQWRRRRRLCAAAAPW